MQTAHSLASCKIYFDMFSGWELWQERETISNPNMGGGARECNYCDMQPHFTSISIHYLQDDLPLKQWTSILKCFPLLTVLQSQTVSGEIILKKGKVNNAYLVLLRNLASCGWSEKQQYNNTRMKLWNVQFHLYLIWNIRLATCPECTLPLFPWQQG